jgi:hypothetical protein
MIILTKNLFTVYKKIQNKISIKYRINMWERSFLLLCETWKKKYKFMWFDLFINIILNLIKLETLYLCFLKSVYNFKRGEEKMNIFEQILRLNFLLFDLNKLCITFRVGISHKVDPLYKYFSHEIIYYISEKYK